jgi:hypothetical protein
VDDIIEASKLTGLELSADDQSLHINLSHPSAPDRP